MPYQDFWGYILSLPFLITFGLVLLPFVPLALSVWITWNENGKKYAELERKERS